MKSRAAYERTLVPHTSGLSVYEAFALRRAVAC